MDDGTHFQEIVDTIAAATGVPVTLEDRDLHLVASSGHDEVIDDVRRDSILRRRSSPQVQEMFAGFGIAGAETPLRIPGDAVPGLLARWCLPARWRKVTYGYLWLLDPDARVTKLQLNSLTNAVDQVAAALATRARAADHTSWAVGELLSADPGARARAVDELHRDGLVSVRDRFVVAALAARGDASPGPLNSWLLPRHILTATVGQRAALVMPEAAAVEVTQRAARTLLAQHPAGVAAGLSGPVTMTDAHEGWRQAGAALLVALRGAEEVTVRHWAGLGVLRLLALADPAVLAATVTDDRAQRLRETGPEVVETARVYLEQAGSAQRTAKLLSIHRQTLYHRLRRITWAGYNLESGTDRLALHLALVLDEFN